MEIPQLGRLIYHVALANMKNTLNLEEFSYREQGRNDPRYKTFKKHLMEHTYASLRDLFHELENIGLLQKTENEEDVKNGYTDSESGGSGYLNSDEFNDFLNNLA